MILVYLFCPIPSLHTMFHQHQTTPLPWTHCLSVHLFANVLPYPSFANLSMWHAPAYHSDRCLRSPSFPLPAGFPPPFLLFSFPKGIFFCTGEVSVIISNLVSEFKLIWVHLLALPLSRYVILDHLFNLPGSAKGDNNSIYSIGLLELNNIRN